jgi:solute carrier family 35 protein F5
MQPVLSNAANKTYQPILGDFLGLISALFYAFYVILLKIRIGSESRVDMRLFFGFVGLFNILFGLPVGLLLHLTGIETLEWPPTRNVVVAMVINVCQVLLLTDEYADCSS